MAVGRILDVEMLALDDSLFPSASYIFIKAGRNLINVGSASRSSLVGKAARCGRHRPTMAPLSKHDALVAGSRRAERGREASGPQGEDTRVNADVGRAAPQGRRFDIFSVLLFVTAAMLMWAADTSHQ